MKRVILFAAVCVASTTACLAKESIVYVRPNQPQQSGDLDVDGDGRPDFYFFNYLSPIVPGFFTQSVVPYRTNQALVFLANGWLASLPQEFPIGPDQYTYRWVGTNTPATQGGALLDKISFSELGVTSSGMFVGGISYMGVAFEIHEHTHYGWVRIQSPDGGFPFSILDWAYEKQPDTMIRAGDKHITHHPRASIIRPGHLRLHWESESGTAYRVQHTSEMDGPWADLGFVVVASSTNCIVEVPMSSAAGFYRIVPE